MQSSSSFRVKRFFLILAKLQEIKLEGTSVERKYANRRFLKTLPRVSLNAENLSVLIHLVVFTNDPSVQI